jgi:hypothetical protein
MDNQNYVIKKLIYIYHVLEIIILYLQFWFDLKYMYKIKFEVSNIMFNLLQPFYKGGKTIIIETPFSLHHHFICRLYYTIF